MPAINQLNDNDEVIVQNGHIALSTQKNHVNIVNGQSTPISINISDREGRVLFNLIISTNSTFPSVDVIRMAEGTLEAASMHNGSWTLRQRVEGNRVVTAILERYDDEAASR